jgi:large subunit ribosomal protein L10
MPNQQNLDTVKTLKDKLTEAKSVVIFDYSGTSVKEQVELRQKVKEAGGEILVTKNTLIGIAIGKDEIKDILEGMNAVVFAYEDEVAPIKALFEFHKETEKLEIKKGLMDDKVLSQAEVEALSKLPSKQELIATLIARIKGPGQGLVNVFTASTRDLISVLNNIAKK